MIPTSEVQTDQSAAERPEPPHQQQSQQQEHHQQGHEHDGAVKLHTNTEGRDSDSTGLKDERKVKMKGESTHSLL